MPAEGMIPELAVLIFLVALGGVGLILRWRSASPSLLGRRLVMAAVAGAILAALAPPSCIAPRNRPPAPLAAIIVDLSRSQGGAIGSRLGLSDEERTGTERVVVVGVGTAAHLLYDGPRDGLGLSLAIPADLLRAPARRKFDFGAAATILSEISRTQPVDLLVLSDGGLDVHRAAELWRERGPALASCELRPLAEPRPDDLSLRLVGAPPQLGSGEVAVAELLVIGELSRRRALECWASGGATRALELGPGPVRERFLLEVAAPPGGAAPEIALRGHETWDRDRELDRLKLLPAAAEDFRVFIWDPRAALGELVRDLKRSPEGKIRVAQGAALPAELGAFDVVVAHDVARPTPLDGRAETALIRFVESGGGLLLSGADAAFGRGAWAGTPVDELSPLAARPGQQPRALRLLLDRSGSMDREDRFRAAARAARALLETLRGEDQAQVWTFADTIDRGPWRGPGEGKAEEERLAGLRARGGTDLLGALESLAAAPTLPEHAAYAFVLTDGRDPRLADAERRRRLLRAVSQSGRRYFVFWFDREAEQETFLRELVEAGRGQLIPLDDFGGLARAFFDAAAGGLERRDLALRNRRGEAVRLARALRTRARPEAEVLIRGGADLVIMARGRRGAGRVLAMPIPLDAPSLSALFGDGEAGIAAFREELRGLAAPRGEGIGAIERQGHRLLVRAQVPRDGVRPRALGWGDREGRRRELPLARIGLDRFVSPPELNEAALPLEAASMLVLDERGEVMARRLCPGADLHDTQPPPGAAARAELRRRLRELPGPSSGDRGPSGLLIAALIALFAADLFGRVRGR
jgi:von Willebrand factor type A domain